MTVTIIGSLSNPTKLEDARNFAANTLNAKVYFPDGSTATSFNMSANLFEVQSTWLKHIDESDLVIAVPKSIERVPNGSSSQIFEIGESTSYEMAYATHTGKQVLIWMY